MDIHPNDKGYTTMVFKLTSPTLQKTLKICVGKPYDEGGRDKYNVYQVSDDNVVVKRIGYYLTEKDTVVMDDKDFPIMKMGEPVYDNVDVKVPPPEKKEAEPVVSKSDYIIIENDATGDCFYDAVIRAETNAADTYSGEKIGQLRTKLAEFISKNPKFKQVILEKYASYKQTKLKRMNQMDGYKELYKRVDQEGEDKESVQEDAAEKGTEVDLDLFGALDGDDFFPDKTEEDVIHFLTNYFNKRTDLEGDKIIEVFTQNLVQPKKWATEDVIAAYQEMNNVQVVPLIQKGTRVEEYMVHPTVLKKEELLPTTKYIFADYTPLTHFKLIVRSSDKKGAFLQSELPAVLQKKISESPILSHTEEKTPEASPLYDPKPPAPAATLAPVTTVEEAPPGTELDQGEPEPVKAKPKAKKEKVPVSQQDVIQLKPQTEDGTRKLTDVPEITQEELDLLSKMKTFDAYEHATKTMPWGKYFTEKGYEAFTASTLKTKQEISTTEKLIKALQAHPNDPTPFYKTKKATTEKKKK